MKSKYEKPTLKIVLKDKTHYLEKSKYHSYDLIEKYYLLKLPKKVKDPKYTWSVRMEKIFMSFYHQ